MKKIRLSIIASSLMLCVWLTASFTTQNLPASPLNAPTPSPSAETNSPSAEPATEAVTDPKKIEQPGITAPVVSK